MHDHQDVVYLRLLELTDLTGYIVHCASPQTSPDEIKKDSQYNSKK